MAIPVPVYNDRVERASIPGYRQELNDPRNAALAQVGEGIQRAAEGIGSAVKTIKEQQDAAATMAAYQKLVQTKQTLLEDPDNGFLAQKGVQAGAAFKGFVDNLRQEANTINQGLTNEEQRKAFSRLAFQEQTSFVESANRHTVQQANEVRRQAFDGAVTAAQSDAIGAASRGDYGQITPAISVIEHAVDANAAHEGWDVTYTASQKKTLATQAHLGVLDTMVENGRVGDAKEYLKAIEPELDGAMLAKSNIQKRIEAGGVRDDARSISDKVWDASGGDWAKAEDRLRAMGIKDTAVFDNAMLRIHERGSQQKAAEEQADKPRLGRLEQSIYTRPSFNQGALMSSDDYQRLTDEGKATALQRLQAEQRSRRESGSKERQIQNEIDRQAEASFRSRDLIGNDGIDQATTDIDQSYPDASKKQRDLLTERQKNVQRQRQKDQGVSLQAFDSQVKEAAQNSGLKKEKSKQFTDYMHDAYFAWTQDPKNEGKKAPPPDVVKKMIGDAMLQGKTPGVLWDSSTHAWEAAQKGKLFVPSAQPDASPQATPTAPPPVAPSNGGLKRHEAAAPQTMIRIRSADGRTGSIPATMPVPAGWTKI